MAGQAPKRAPKDVPVEAAYYLDKAAEQLAAFANDEGFKLHPYEAHEPGRSWWTHGIYGNSRDRDICIQVVTTETMATTFVADLKGYVCLHRDAGEVLYPRGDPGGWQLLEVRRVEGMEELMTGVSELTDRLRLTCIWGMPHATDPDPRN